MANIQYSGSLSDFVFDVGKCPKAASLFHYVSLYLLGLEAGEVGLVLTYAITLVGNFQWTVRQSAEVENMVRTDLL